MASWAELNENNVVIKVLVGDNNDPNNDEGYQWLVDNCGGRWIKTSYNTFGNKHSLGGEPLRGNFGTLGMTYDETRDVFLHPKTLPSWIIDEETFLWVPPINPPSPKESYRWDEDSVSWVAV
jgi:hypothetical protein